MRAVLVLFVAIVAIAAAIRIPNKRLGCNKMCMARALDGSVSKKQLLPCIRGCLSLNNTKDDTVSTIKQLRRFAKVLQKGIQTDIAELKMDDNEEENNVSSESSIAPGATLEVTADALNVRNGPCTSAGIISSLSRGARVTFTGDVKSGCGYTWYGIKGSFGSGYAASNFLKEVGGGSKTCKTRWYPLFKQCDPKWGNDRLGSDSTICKVGCLMSSVSMALNGLGKRISGQESNPKTLNSYLLSHGGYYGNLFVWGSVSLFGLSYQGQPTNIQVIKDHVCANRVVILNVNNGGHWVLATGVEADGSFSVNDPGATRYNYPASAVVRAGIYYV